MSACLPVRRPESQKTSRSDCVAEEREAAVRVLRGGGEVEPRQVRLEEHRELAGQRAVALDHTRVAELLRVEVVDSGAHHTCVTRLAAEPAHTTIYTTH